MGEKPQSGDEKKKKNERDEQGTEPRRQPITTKEVMQGDGTRDESTPGEGVLTSRGADYDTATD